MRKKSLIAVGLSALLCAGLIIALSGPTEAQKTYTLKIACTQPAGEENPTGWGLDLLGKEVERRSGGRIKAIFLGSSQMGSGRKVLEMVQNNVVQVCDDTLAQMEVFSTKFAPLSLPYLFPSREVAFKFADESPIMKELVAAVEKDSGLRVMGFFENGSRNITNSTRPIKTPDDVKGLKMRVMQSQLYIKLMEAMGAQAVPVAYSELFTALQQKVVDGQENPISVIRSGKLYEVQKYLTLSGHVFDYLIISVNPEWYDELPDDLKVAFDEAMAYTAVAQRQKAADLENASIEFLASQGMEVTRLTPEEHQAFRDRIQGPVTEWLIENYPQEKENMGRIIAEVERLAAAN
jgi:tripartite ATP-independent transporter DctP family solute receptor